MNVIPFDPATHIHRNEPAHIDIDSRWLLMAVFSELVAIRDGEPDCQRAEQLRTITRALGAVLERFEPGPPKGAA